MKKISAIILLFPLILYSAVDQWQTFTNSSDIRQFVFSESTMWSATNGGVLRLETITKEFAKYTNTEGLSQIDVVAIAYDVNGFVWAAMPDGLLQILNVNTGHWEIYNEFQNRLTVEFILPFQDFVLIGSDIGIAELRLDAKNKWERTWKADIGLVRNILITDEYIWVAQSDGIRRIELNFPNKQIPSAWQHYGAFDGLPSTNVLTLLKYGNLIAAGTDEGIVFFEGTAWINPEATNHQVRDLCEWDNTLCMASSMGVFKRQNDTWIQLGAYSNDIYNIGASITNKLWCGSKNSGLAEYDSSQNVWNNYLPNCPGSNSFSDLVFDFDGHLWASSSKSGVSYFDGLTWKNFSTSNGLPRNDYRAIEVDGYGRIWAGSWGSGVTVFEKMENDSIIFSNMFSFSGSLTGIDGAPDYVVVTDLRLDEFGYMWFLNYAAANKEALDVFDGNVNWQHWSLSDGIKSEKVTALEIDYFGRKWIGTESAGLSVVDDNKTPFDKSDDYYAGDLTTSDGLESNNIKALAIDLDGTIWIGTSGGLNYWFQESVGVRYSVINDDINTLLVDPQNNKWIGTAGGLSVLDSDNFSWTHYSTSNSLLVSDYITCFAFNAKTGEIYIGTTNGLSRLETPYTQPADNLNSVKGFPNPFIIDPLNSRFYIENLAQNSSVSIFTSEGFLVKTIPDNEILGARATWDGTNNNGDFVASGVYLYLVTTKQGAAKTGKVAVIHP